MRRRRLVRKKVVRKDGVKVEGRIAVEATLFAGADKKLDRVLVVEDHLRLEPVASFRLFAELDQAPGIQKGIGVALEPARVPGQVDEETAQNRLRVGACRLRREMRLAHLGKVRAFGRREIEAPIRAVGIQKSAVIPGGSSRGGRLLQVGADFLAGRRNRHGRFAFPRNLGRPGSHDGSPFDGRQTAPRPAALALLGEPAFVHEGFEPVLQGAERNFVPESLGDLARSHAGGPPP
jgi:hypothetical protein